MMKTIKLLVTTMALLAIASPAFAEKDKADKSADKERTATITGEGKCAKCSLKEGDKCQNVIEAENKKGKKVAYYLTDNDIAKEFHKNICKESKKVTATGTVKKGTEKGKMELTATKIEEVK
jgi:RecG-like helicase